MNLLPWKDRRAFAASLLLGVAAVMGCGGGLHSVKGTVKLDDGTPVTKGLVLFESVDQTPPVTARGDIQPDGSFQLSTFNPGDGVPAGKYRARISPQDFGNVDGLEGPPRPPVFDNRYTDSSTSGLEFEVKSGSNEIPIRLRKPQKPRG